MTTDLLPGRRKALASLCGEFHSLGWILLAEHREQLPKDTARDLRQALSILRRLHEDFTPLKTK